MNGDVAIRLPQTLDHMQYRGKYSSFLPSNECLGEFMQDYSFRQSLSRGYGATVLIFELSIDHSSTARTSLCPTFMVIANCRLAISDSSPCDTWRELACISGKELKKKL